MKINCCFDKMYKFSSYLFIFFFKNYSKCFLFVVKRFLSSLCLILFIVSFHKFNGISESYQGLSSCELR